ncbi:MAG: Sec-independent protein translocase protein TatB, partial [Arcobacteraceae bacterium]|nr:Sec-independent protein translocase protein TatB [Arcobacteraceae bacterium]
MFGMGFFEILLVAVIAIIALGPEKLPTAMVEVARFFKKFKSGIDEAKSTLDNELQLSDMKEEASKFKAQI